MIGTGIGLGLSGYRLPTARDSLDPTVVLDLPFADTGSLTAAVGPTPTFTRASAAWYFNSAGIMQQAAINQPRFGYWWNDWRGTWDNIGLICEIQTTNYCLWNRDLTNAVWTASNMTVAKNQTGIDNVSSSASSITATAANATIEQNMASLSGIYLVQFWVKRLSGTGSLEYSVNNGTNWTSVLGIGSNWKQAPFSDAVNGMLSAPSISAPTNTKILFRVPTSGDSFAIDCVMVANTRGNSPIPTTSSAVTVSADIIEITGSSASSLWGTERSMFISNSAGLTSNTGTRTSFNWYPIGDSYPPAGSRLTGIAPGVRNQFAVGTISGGNTMSFSGSTNRTKFSNKCNVAYRIKANDLYGSHFVEGSTVAGVGNYSSTTWANVPTASDMTRLLIGNGLQTGQNDGFVGIRQIKIFNSLKTNAELDALVTY